jgi:UDP-2,3-diacylglucosamine pyrophosphatase LpxH
MSIVGPSFDRVYVISDLHMGGPTGRQIFNTADRLEKFVNAIAKEKGDIALVINGDAVDFLAESGAIHFDPQGALEKLSRIYMDPAFTPAWRALEGLVAAGKTLVITLGNHDPELALPEVRAWLLHKLTRGDVTAVGRIVMSYDGAGYRCNVGGRSVLCTHGNEVDAWNVIDYGRLCREARDANQGRPPVDAWTVNAGTRMVIEVMNGVKREHPFVDLLKPEQEAVIPTLVAINPKLLTQLLDVMGLGREMKGDKKRIDQRLLTHAEAEASDSTDALDDFARFLGKQMGEDFGKDSDDEASLLLGARAGAVESEDDPGEDELLGVGDYFRSLFGRKERTAERLRRSLSNLLEGDSTFAINHEDDTFKGMDARVSRHIDYIVTGHTHLIRSIARAGGGWYFNSGTWIRLIELTKTMLEPKPFNLVWKALQSDRLADLDAATVGGTPLVKIFPTGVRIVHEDGAVHGELFEVSEEGTQRPIAGTRKPHDG